MHIFLIDKTSEMSKIKLILPEPEASIFSFLVEIVFFEKTIHELDF